MKTFLGSLILILLMTQAEATTLKLFTVKQPIFLEGSDTGGQINIMDVCIVSFRATPETYYSAICLPFIPPTDGSWKEPKDVNLASRCGIKVSPHEDKSSHMVVTIDASNAKVPAGCPFTLDQVIDSVSTCVKLVLPVDPESVRRFSVVIVPPAK